MAEATETARQRIVTTDGIVTATVLDRLAPERLALALVRGAAGARYTGKADGTALVPRALKDLLVNPESEA
jgi:hypothetical protein